MDETVCIVGLGYVGLPLAVECAKHFRTIGFDVSSARIGELRECHDRTHEVTRQDLQHAHWTLTDDAREIGPASCYIVTVPTPVDRHKRPDLSALVAASETVGAVLHPGDLVVFESTVYPGATEEVCVPVLAEASGLTYNRDFFVGYSPERVNPGDATRRVSSILKITSGSTPETADRVDALYSKIITAGTYRAPSMRVAEAAKVIENTQRDVNIALINELAILFNKLGLETQEVLAAAGTKWNFLPFRPGLVGGHCIGVDPYYLTHKAQEVGHHPEVILAGRRMNDAMGGYVADQVVLLMARAGRTLASSRVLVLGLAFKENCPDLRNTRVIDVVRRLEGYGIVVDVCDPLVDAEEARKEYDLLLKEHPLYDLEDWDAVVLAVAHELFLDDQSLVKALADSDTIVYDVKAALPAEVGAHRL